MTNKEFYTLELFLAEILIVTDRKRERMTSNGTLFFLYTFSASNKCLRVDLIIIPTFLKGLHFH